MVYEKGTWIEIGYWFLRWQIFDALDKSDLVDRVKLRFVVMFKNVVRKYENSSVQIFIDMVNFTHIVIVVLDDFKSPFF